MTLELRNVCKRFPGVLAVNNVTFSAQAGEITGYLGPNGSGKSTTMKMIAGLIEMGSGEILFDGEPIRRDLIAHKQRMGYVPEEPHLYAHLSGLEYLTMVAQLRGLSTKRMAERIEGLLCLLSLHQTATRPSRPIRKACARRSFSPQRSCTILICSCLTSRSPALTFPQRWSCAASCRS